MNRNNLNESNYLITQELHNALYNEKLYETKEEITKKSGIYVIAVRLLKKGERILVYNYIYYPPIFIDTFISFLVTMNVDSIRYKEWGDNLVLFNKDLLLYSKYINEINLEAVDRYILNDNAFLKSVLDRLSSYSLHSDIPEIIRIINKLKYLTSDYKDMANILEKGVTKDFDSFIGIILSGISINNILGKPVNESISLVNSLLFVVKDLNQFVKAVSDKDFIINEGNQKWRGQVNSMNALLGSFDMDYRTSLYNHNNYHVRKGYIERKFELDKNKFSFRNIHMNLGNIRWYSTKKVVDRKSLSKKLMTRVTMKNSFKSNSELYLYLSNYLRSSPINETTERNIENYLLNFYNQSLEDKKDKLLIKYDLFTDVHVKKYIIEAVDILKDYLDNFRKNSFNINVKRVTFRLKCSYNLNLILRELDNSEVIEICLGILARIISGFTKTNEDCIGQNIIADLGDMIIKTYFYSMYKNYIIKNIESFIIKCEEYLDLNKTDLEVNIKYKMFKAISKLKNNYTTLDVYELKLLTKKVSGVNDLSKVDFNYKDLIIQYTLSDWIEDNKKLVDSYDNNLKFGLASIIIDWLKESNLIQENLLVIGRTERRTYFIPSDNLVKLLNVNKNKTVSSLPVRIPMLVKPKLYTREIINGSVKERLGGYLINDEKVTDTMIIPNWELKESSVIKDPNVIYNLVNNVNSVGFKINKEMLDFIYLHGDKINLLLNFDINFNMNKSKITKREYTELESYVSKLDLQDNILGLAELFSEVPVFYLPVRIDYRGRMNCISQYLNYQSNELAKSLLLFSKGEKLMKNDITAINYFKAYGANCFGNKLDKKSWSDRSKWIDDNQEDIINYTNFKLINKADNKLLFTAFCIEYNKWLQSYNNIETSYFETHLPIQLDATCNGYQHLSLLISDYDMAKELNLTKSTKEDSPKDYYGFMAIKLSELFRNKINQNNLSIEDKSCYERLSGLFIRRGTIKKAIMTIPYNVSTIQMISYLKENFINISDGKREGWSNYDLVYQYKEDPKVILSNKDISLIASGLREVLEKNFPRLRLLIVYLRTIAKIFNKLNLYIPWGTSSGLLVNQSYTSSKEIKLRPFSYDKSSFTLKIPTNNLSGNKQIRAFMPNLIHSLDAAALALLAEYLFNDDVENKSFYAIHDCFAVTANNIEILIKYLKLVYVKIYSEDDYLREFDKQMIRHIKYHYGENSYNSDTREINVTVDNTEIKETFPNIDYVLGTQLPSPDLIKNSSYIIN